MAITEAGKNRIMIFGPKADGTYVIEFRTAAGEALAISIPRAGHWHRRSTMAPLDSQPVATILQTESSRRSTTTDEKCHPRPRHRSAA
jgi:hypothetical protein